MSELSGLYALWEREFKIFLRERSRIASSLINPVLWLFVFGGGLGSEFNVGSVNYQTFIYPGIIVMTIIFSSIFYGAYVVWDRRLDFLKEVLVAPINRSTAFLGKALGGTTDGLIESTIILFLAPIFGISAGLSFALVYLLLFILIIGLVSVGLIIGSLMESPEGFGLISGFVTFPLFFLSGALYQLSNLPAWLSIITLLNPITYGVDAIRGLMLGTYKFGLLIDGPVLVIFALAVIGIGTFTFKRMKL
jgi:ABC-2 type transport system permease protein